MPLLLLIVTIVIVDYVNKGNVIALSISNINCTDDHVRLTGLESPLIGRLEICHNNTWAGVCNDGLQWTLRNSIVVCKMLGYEGAVQINPLLSKKFRKSTIQPTSSHINPPKCHGIEKHLSECRNTSFIPKPQCTNEVFVFCSVPHDGDVRLIGPGNEDNTGIVEVYTHNYGWSTTCTNDWTNEEANVVCRALDYKKGSRKTSNYISFNMPMQRFDYFKCTGEEQDLLECQSQNYPGGCRTISRGAVSCNSNEHEDILIILIIAISVGVIIGVIIVIIVIIMISKAKKKQAVVHDNHYNVSYIQRSEDAPPTYFEACENEHQEETVI
jgi:hypothetical protein